jgi:hypothetical protein
MRIPDVHGAIDVPASTPLDVQEFVDSPQIAGRPGICRFNGKDYPIYEMENQIPVPNHQPGKNHSLLSNECPWPKLVTGHLTRMEFSGYTN